MAHSDVQEGKIMNKNKRYPAAFMIPGVGMYLLFFILPVLIGVYYSFTNWNFTRAEFVGLRNYINILSDPGTKGALINTIVFTVVTTVGKVGIGLGSDNAVHAEIGHFIAAVGDIHLAQRTADGAAGRRCEARAKAQHRCDAQKHRYHSFSHKYLLKTVAAQTIFQVCAAVK